MPATKPKIALLFCGGSGIITDRGVQAVRQAKDIKAWLDAVPELSLIADIEPVFVFGGDPSEIQPEMWVKLGREIFKRYQKFDGFVVTHGVDTMVYTAAMMSFMIQPHVKPIVFTGSPLVTTGSEKKPQDLSGLITDYKSLGVKANLINALQVATMDVGEVCIMFGNRLTRATHTIKSETPSFNFFDAEGDTLLGKVDFGIKLLETVKHRTDQKARLLDAIDKNVQLVQLYPGATPENLKNMIDSGAHGIIVRSFNTNLFPDSFRPVLEQAFKKRIPIVAHNSFALESKKKKREYIVVNDMTFETTFVKFMWSLGQTKDVGKIRILMWENGL
ncbi:MAG: asparaginase domain-containing protein [Patescibacteria group bacterium]|jgi:L-asparaginase